MAEGDPLDPGRVDPELQTVAAQLAADAEKLDAEKTVVAGDVRKERARVEQQRAALVRYRQQLAQARAALSGHGRARGASIKGATAAVRDLADSIIELRSTGAALDIEQREVGRLIAEMAEAQGVAASHHQRLVGELRLAAQAPPPPPAPSRRRAAAPPKIKPLSASERSELQKRIAEYNKSGDPRPKSGDWRNEMRPAPQPSSPSLGTDTWRKQLETAMRRPGFTFTPDDTLVRREIQKVLTGTADDLRNRLDLHERERKRLTALKEAGKDNKTKAQIERELNRVKGAIGDLTRQVNVEAAVRTPALQRLESFDPDIVHELQQRGAAVYQARANLARYDAPKQGYEGQSALQALVRESEFFLSEAMRVATGGGGMPELRTQEAGRRVQAATNRLRSGNLDTTPRAELDELENVVRHAENAQELLEEIDRRRRAYATANPRATHKELRALEFPEQGRRDLADKVRRLADEVTVAQNRLRAAQDTENRFKVSQTGRTYRVFDTALADTYNRSGRQVGGSFRSFESATKRAAQEQARVSRSPALTQPLVDQLQQQIEAGTAQVREAQAALGAFDQRAQQHNATRGQAADAVQAETAAVEQNTSAKRANADAAADVVRREDSYSKRLGAFIRAAKALPPVAEKHTRLFRGEGDSKFEGSDDPALAARRGRWFTDSLPMAADYGHRLRYVDVPHKVADASLGPTADKPEFILPEEWAQRAQDLVGQSTRAIGRETAAVEQNTDAKRRGAAAERLYHVGPIAGRESIAREGLRLQPGGFPDVYLFKQLEDARAYAAMKARNHATPSEVYEVDPRGVEVRGDAGYALKTAPIAPEHLRLLEAATDGTRENTAAKVENAAASARVARELPREIRSWMELRDALANPLYGPDDLRNVQSNLEGARQRIGATVRRSRQADGPYNRVEIGDTLLGRLGREGRGFTAEPIGPEGGFLRAIGQFKTQAAAVNALLEAFARQGGISRPTTHDFIRQQIRQAEQFRDVNGGRLHPNEQARVDALTRLLGEEDPRSRIPQGRTSFEIVEKLVKQELEAQAAAEAPPPPPPPPRRPTAAGGPGEDPRDRLRGLADEELGRQRDRLAQRAATEVQAGGITDQTRTELQAVNEVLRERVAIVQQDANATRTLADVNRELDEQLDRRVRGHDERAAGRLSVDDYKAELAAVRDAEDRLEAERRALGATGSRAAERVNAEMRGRFDRLFQAGGVEGLDPADVEAMRKDLGRPLVARDDTILNRDEFQRATELLRADTAAMAANTEATRENVRWTAESTKAHFAELEARNKKERRTWDILTPEKARQRVAELPDFKLLNGPQLTTAARALARVGEHERAAEAMNLDAERTEQARAARIREVQLQRRGVPPSIAGDLAHFEQGSTWTGHRLEFIDRMSDDIRSRYEGAVRGVEEFLRERKLPALDEWLAQRAAGADPAEALIRQRTEVESDLEVARRRLEEYDAQRDPGEGAGRGKAAQKAWVEAQNAFAEGRTPLSAEIRRLQDELEGAQIRESPEWQAQQAQRAADVIEDAEQRKADATEQAAERQQRAVTEVDSARRKGLEGSAVGGDVDFDKRLTADIVEEARRAAGMADDLDRLIAAGEAPPPDAPEFERWLEKDAAAYEEWLRRRAAGVPEPPVPPRPPTEPPSSTPAAGGPTGPRSSTELVRRTLANADIMSEGLEEELRHAAGREATERYRSFRQQLHGPLFGEQGFGDPGRKRFGEPIPSVREVVPPNLRSFSPVEAARYHEEAARRALEQAKLERERLRSRKEVSGEELRVASDQVVAAEGARDGAVAYRQRVEADWAAELEAAGRRKEAVQAHAQWQQELADRARARGVGGVVPGKELELYRPAGLPVHVPGLGRTGPSLADARMRAMFELRELPGPEDPMWRRRQVLQERRRRRLDDIEGTATDVGGGGRRGGGPPTSFLGGAEGPEPLDWDDWREKMGRAAAVTHNLTPELQYLARAHASAADQMHRHGLLTTEFLSAMAAGRTTIREVGTQMGGTLLKFGGWTTAAALTYAGLAAIGQVGTGAIESAQGVTSLQRVVNNLNTDRARGEFRALSDQFNIPIGQVTGAAYEASKAFKVQEDQAKATKAALYGVKIGELDPQDASRYVTAIARGFNLGADDLQAVIDRINQLQNKFGAGFGETMRGVAAAAGSFGAAGGQSDELASLVATGQLRTGKTGQEIATALRRTAEIIKRPERRTRIIDLLGVDPRDTSVTDVIKTAMDKVAQGGDVNELARAITTPELASRAIIPILRGRSLYQRMLSEVSGTSADKSAERELEITLQGPRERLAEFNVELQRLGSALEQSGALSGVALLVSGINMGMEKGTGLLGVLNAIPEPLRQAASLATQLGLALTLARRFDVGRYLGDNAAGRYLGRHPAGRRRAEILQGVEDERQFIIPERQRVTREEARIRRRAALMGERVGVLGRDVESAEEELQGRLATPGTDAEELKAAERRRDQAKLKFDSASVRLEKVTEDQAALREDSVALAEHQRELDRQERDFRRLSTRRALGRHYTEADVDAEARRHGILFASSIDPRPNAVEPIELAADQRAAERALSSEELAVRRQALRAQQRAARRVMLTGARDRFFGALAPPFLMGRGMPVGDVYGNWRTNVELRRTAVGHGDLDDPAARRVREDARAQLAARAAQGLTLRGHVTNALNDTDTAVGRFVEREREGLERFNARRGQLVQRIRGIRDRVSGTGSVFDNWRQNVELRRTAVGFGDLDDPAARRVREQARAQLAARAAQGLTLRGAARGFRERTADAMLLAQIRAMEFVNGLGGGAGEKGEEAAAATRRARTTLDRQSGVFRQLGTGLRGLGSSAGNLALALGRALGPVDAALLGGLAIYAGYQTFADNHKKNAAKIKHYAGISLTPDLDEAQRQIDEAKKENDSTGQNVKDWLAGAAADTRNFFHSLPLPGILAQIGPKGDIPKGSDVRDRALQAEQDQVNEFGALVASGQGGLTRGQITERFHESLRRGLTVDDALKDAIEQAGQSRGVMEARLSRPDPAKVAETFQKRLQENLRRGLKFGDAVNDALKQAEQEAQTADPVKVAEAMGVADEFTQWITGQADGMRAVGERFNAANLTATQMIAALPIRVFKRGLSGHDIGQISREISTERENLARNNDRDGQAQIIDNINNLAGPATAELQRRFEQQMQVAPTSMKPRLRRDFMRSVAALTVKPIRDAIARNKSETADMQAQLDREQQTPLPAYVTDRPGPAIAFGGARIKVFKEAIAANKKDRADLRLQLKVEQLNMKYLRAQQDQQGFDDELQRISIAAFDVPAGTPRIQYQLGRVGELVNRAIAKFGRDGAVTLGLIQQYQQLQEQAVQEGEADLQSIGAYNVATATTPGDEAAAKMQDLQKRLRYRQAHYNVYGPRGIREVRTQIRELQKQEAQRLRQEALDMIDATATRDQARSQSTLRDLRIAARAAHQKLRVGGFQSPGERRRAQAGAIEGDQAVKDEMLRRELEGIDHRHEIGRLTDQAWIAAMQRVLRTLKKGSDAWRNLKMRIESAKHDMDQNATALDLDVGSVRLPTTYEIRRSIGAAGQDTHNTTVNATVTVTGVSDPEAAATHTVRKLARVMATSGNSRRRAS